MRGWLVAAAVGLIGTVSAQTPAGTVTGAFKAVKRGAIQPTSAAALPARQPGDPRKWLTLVVLAEGGTMDPAAAVASLNPQTALLNQPGMRGRNHISLAVRPDGFVGLNATFADGNVQYLDSTRGPGAGALTARSLVAEWTVNGPDRIAGRVRSAKPATTMSGDTYEVDVTFDVPITKRPAMTPLGPTGGEPGRVVQALLTALRSKNWKALQSCVKAETLASLTSGDASEAENFEVVADHVSLLLPRGTARVVGGEGTDSVAIIEVQGAMAADGGAEALYLVRLTKEPEGWRFDRAGIAGLL